MAIADGGSSSSGSGSNPQQQQPPPIDPRTDLYAVLEGSALIPFLESKLQANSFLEICSHTNVYRCVINIIKEIGRETFCHFV